MRALISPCKFLRILATWIIILPAHDSNANWIKTQSNISAPNSSYTSYASFKSNAPFIPNSAYNQNTKSDSLPSGVSKEWLNKLRDENGNRIMPEENVTDFIQQNTFNPLGPSEGFGGHVSSAGDVNGDGYEDIIIGALHYKSDTGRAYIFYGGTNWNTEPDVILTGEAFSEFGNSVSSGDFNGDGFSDVVVGAHRYNSNTANIGRVYIYLGGAEMDSFADLKMTGEGPNSYFGNWVSTAGDVNADGYTDFIVGAPAYGSSTTGKAYIYFGGTAIDTLADVIMNGQQVNSQFGNSVSTAGDVNGDGYSDVIIGARGYNSNTGRAYIYFGGASMDNIRDVTMDGEGGYYGTCVSTAGDVNGDGFDDVIVGAYRHNSSRGKVYVYFGGSQMNNGADVTMTGEEPNALFGMATSSAGDLNRDGYSDIIVGAAHDFSPEDTGKVYVYFGGAAMDNIADVTMSGESLADNFGASVAATGDFNGDGYTELLVGASEYNSQKGRVYFYDYTTTSEIISDITMTGEGTNNYFGAAVSSAGDVNNDGYSDVIVGAPTYNSNTGRAYIFFGGAVMNNTPDIIMNGQATNNYFGHSVSSAGDVNNDGYDDVIIGALWYGGGTGRAYIYYGGAAMDNSADVTLIGEEGHYGSSVSSAGDVNGDGFDDVIVGAYNYGSNVGRAYIYYGGTAMNNGADVIMNGDEPNGLFGIAVSTAGDVNRDGYSDVIVGAPHELSPGGIGKAYIFFGGLSMDAIADLTMIGEEIGDDFGASVSKAGDVNGDGFSDIIVGAMLYNNYAGRVYIYHGGTSMDNIADVIMDGETPDYYLGRSVSSAGDVNGDGYSDVIVGADLYDSVKGRAHIYFGGAQMNNIPDVTMTGEAANNEFGICVSSAGDVNNDGFSDVIVGAQKNNSNTGKAYIYLASAIGSPVNKKFRSRVSGNWNTPLTWEMSTNGGVNWVQATSYPNDLSDDITIRNSHVVRVTEKDSADYIAIENGGQLSIDSLITFKLNNLNNSGIISVTGTLISTGTIEYNGTSPQTLVTTNINHANLTINNPSGVTVSDNFSIRGSLSIVSGSLNLNGKTITLLDTARLIETPGNTVRGNSGSITTTRSINQPNSLDIAGLGAVITSSANFGLTTITREHNVQNVSSGKPSISRSFTITPQNNNALNAHFIFKYDSSELDTLNESTLGLYHSTNGGVSYKFERGTVDTVNNQIALNYVQSFSKWTAARDSNIVSYGSELTDNLYAKGKLCVTWGSLDTIGVRINRSEIPENDSIKINYLIKDEESFQFIFDTTFTVPYFEQFDTLIRLRMPLMVVPGPHSVIVQAIPDELDPINGFDIRRYCFDVTCDAFSYIEPCGAIDGGTGFDGEAGRMSAGFNNMNSTEVFPIRAIDHSFIDSGSGNVPYKLAIYEDNGSGKPGNVLYISPELFTPQGNGTVQTVTHELDSAVNIPPLSRFYVGYIQNSSANIRASFQTEVPVRNNTFYFSSSDTNNAWIDFAVDSTKNLRFDISPRTSTTLSMNAFLGGFYDASNRIMASDTISLTIRNFNPPYDTIDQDKSLIGSDGTADFDFLNVVRGAEYYFVVQHRNHLETWSHDKPEKFDVCGKAYNFTDNITKAFGDNQIMINNSPEVFAFYGGDVNQDGIIELTDVVLINNDVNSFTTGYVSTDINGDNMVDLEDILIAFNNNNNFVSVERPGNP